MEIPEPKPGLVINYSYVWWDQARAGQEEGSKDRPCVITHTDAKDDRTVVSVSPITHTPPREGSNAVELPHATKQRLGLDDARSWVVTTERNQFEWPGYDLRPISRNKPQVAYGSLPENMTADIQTHVQERARERTVSRDEPLSVRDRGHDDADHKRDHALSRAAGEVRAKSERDYDHER
jgi:hypothetical protein